MSITINQAQLKRAVPNLNKKRLDEFVASFNMWAEHFGINTKKRVVHYLAQVFMESGALKATSENMNYSADRLQVVFKKYFKTREMAEQYARKSEKIANLVYANRMGNGGEASGDGWRYRGRGFIGLTGKQNYADFSRFDLCTEDVVKNPDAVAEFPLNQVCAMWFWQKYGLNELADKDNADAVLNEVEDITRRVNGGLNGIQDRKYYYRRFAREFDL